MATQGVPIEQIEDEQEREKARVFAQANLGFIQTLPLDSVVTEEGIYPNLAEQERTRRQRAEDEVGVGDTEEATTTNTSPNRKRDSNDQSKRGDE